MKKIYFFTLCLLQLTIALFAKEVPLDLAKRVAINWMSERMNIAPASFTVNKTYTLQQDGIPALYIFNLTPKSYVIISADDIASPVVAYSNEGYYSDSISIPAFEDLITGYKKEIVSAKNSNLQPLPQTKQSWDTYTIESSSFKSDNRATISNVSQILSTSWGQSGPYNYKCPDGGLSMILCTGNTHAVTGCVATAMAQVMKSHNYPTTGRDTHSYTHPTYGTLNADFGHTTYSWSNMLNSYPWWNILISDAQKIAVETLMVHCGISVDMNYGCSSGAYDNAARNAFVNYFKYSIKTAILWRDNNYFTDNQWIALLKDELDNSRAIYYRGQGPDGGHAFVIDGYEGENHFHVNWGWEGSDNGLFLFNALTPGNYQFNNVQAAIVNTIPSNDANGVNDNRPVMFVCQRKWEAPKDGGTTDPIYVLNSNPYSTTSINYTISKNATWLTLSTPNGATAGNFTVTASSNTTSTVRTGTVTITATTSNVVGSTYTITVTQPPNGVTNAVDVALVIDRSGSMATSYYLEPAKNAAKTFVQNMQNDDNIAVVSFCEYATVNFPLTKIVSDATKISAQNAITGIYSEGYTSIGAGLVYAKDQLALGRPSSPQAIVLLSDGYENGAPYVSTVLPTIPQNINIYTVALGSASDQTLLNNIATSKGGKYYFAPDASAIQQIYSFIRGSITNLQNTLTASGTLSPSSSKTYTAPIDNSTSEATFSINNQSGTSKLALQTPSGTIINSSNVSTFSNISYSSNSLYEIYKVTAPEKGTWILTVTNQSSASTCSYLSNVQVASDFRMYNSFGQSVQEQNQPMQVNCILTKNYVPVTGATIMAYIQKPAVSMNLAKKPHDDNINTSSLQPPVPFVVVLDSIQLYDDGLHADGAENDGNYSNTYTKTDKTGSYTVKIIAEGNSGTIGSFRREFSFSTIVNASSKPQVPTPLSVPNGSSNVHLNVKLNWTSVTNASKYNLEVSYFPPNQQSQLPVSIIDSLITSDSMMIGGLKPNTTYFWRVRAISSSNTASDWSQQWSFSTSLDLNKNIVCYPNPFNPIHEILNISFKLSNNGRVTFNILDNSGRVIKVLKADNVTGDVGNVQWNGRTDANDLVANGVYLCIAESDNGDKAVGKIAVIK